MRGECWCKEKDNGLEQILNAYYMLDAVLGPWATQERSSSCLMALYTLMGGGGTENKQRNKKNLTSDTIHSSLFLT